MQQSHLPRRQVLSTGPESDASLCQVCHILSARHVTVQAGVRIRWQDVPERMSSARSRLPDGKGHTDSVQGTLQE